MAESVSCQICHKGKIITQKRKDSVLPNSLKEIDRHAEAIIYSYESRTQGIETAAHLIWSSSCGPQRGKSW